MLFHLTEQNKTVSAGKAYAVENGFSVTYTPVHRMVRKGGVQAGTDFVWNFLVEWGAGEALTLVAGWLVAKLSGRVKSLKLNGKVVPVTEDAVLAVLREANPPENRTPPTAG